MSTSHDSTPLSEIYKKLLLDCAEMKATQDTILYLLTKDLSDDEHESVFLKKRRNQLANISYLGTDKVINLSDEAKQVMSDELDSIETKLKELDSKLKPQE